MTERVVIVGGTSGIGLATAERLAGDVHPAYQVVVTGRDQGRLDAAVKRLGENATGARVDATDEAATMEFFRGLEHVDHVVITVTRSGGVGSLVELTADDFRAAADGKLVAHATTARAASKVLRKDGSITFVSAASAGGAYPGTAGLAAVNAGVEAMVPVLAVEWKPLRVNAVSPGVVATPWWGWLPAADRQRTFDGFAAATPVGRVGQADDIASAIAFVIGNTYVDGIVLRVDGGARLGAGG
jgi:NAD(P)-dependent dehydrogenase (short-subunit alcohol dehydrogenase family)